MSILFSRFRILSESGMTFEEAAQNLQNNLSRGEDETPADARPFSPLDYYLLIGDDSICLGCNREACPAPDSFGHTENGANFRALVEAAKIHHCEQHGGTE